MKLFLLSVCIVFLMGCGKSDVPKKAQRIVYPALNESPPPPLPIASVPDEEPDEAPPGEKLVLEEPPENQAKNSWMEQIIQKEDLIKSLKEQAAKAEPGDPFALTEEAIEALSKIDGLTIE